MPEQQQEAELPPAVRIQRSCDSKPALWKQTALMRSSKTVLHTGCVKIPCEQQDKWSCVWVRCVSVYECCVWLVCMTDIMMLNSKRCYARHTALLFAIVHCHSMSSCSLYAFTDPEHESNTYKKTHKHYTDQMAQSDQIFLQCFPVNKIYLLDKQNVMGY